MFGQEKLHNVKFAQNNSFAASQHPINITPYQWEEATTDQTESEPAFQAQFASYSTVQQPESTPIEIRWRKLVSINFELKYNEEMETEMYAPVFGEEIEALDGKEVVIKGYVIPIAIDENEEVLSLSLNPYASCFFCGKASPASVMSLYMKKKKRYKIDDYRKFKGTLELNVDNPTEFYYILRDAVEVE